VSFAYPHRVTDYPYGVLSPDDYVPYLRQQAAAFASALRLGPLDARVPSCPEWTVRELAAHLGGVHEWACAIVTTGPQDRRHGPIDGDPAEWYEQRAARLIDTLLDKGADQACWTHQRDNRRTGYWFRRQAHEISMHRADADLAISGTATYPAELAADGIGEVLDIWLPRMAKYRGPQPLAAPLSLRATDTSDRWLLSPQTDGPPIATGPTATGESAAEVAGSAADLLFRLWNRPSSVDISGDRECAEQFLGAALTS
jgi:uncharacterized protein (TIGR03083 family)